MVYITNAQEMIDVLCYFYPQKRVAGLLKISYATLIDWRSGKTRPTGYRYIFFEKALKKLRNDLERLTNEIDRNPPQMTTEPDALDPIVDWLAEQLAERPVRLGVIQRRAHKAGFTDHQLRRAAKRLDIRSKVSGFGIKRTATWGLSRMQTPEGDR